MSTESIIARRIVQINLHIARQAQDLVMQNMREWKIELAIIEPNRIPEYPDWVGDRTCERIHQVSRASNWLHSGSVEANNRHSLLYITKCCYVGARVVSAGDS